MSKHAITLVEVADRAGVVPEEMHLIHGPFTRDGGYASAQALLSDGPRVTCLFAVNDVMAVGAMAAISSLWRRRHARCSANVAGCGTTAGSRANSAGARQQLRVDHVGLVLARSPRRHPPLCVIRCPAPATRAHHQFPEPGSPERRAPATISFTGHNGHPRSVTAGTPPEATLRDRSRPLAGAPHGYKPSIRSEQPEQHRVSRRNGGQGT